MINSTSIGFSITPQTSKIPFLMFVDDSLVFFKATNTSCNIIIKIVNDFSGLSGQLVNYHKSTIFSVKSLIIVGETP